MRAENESRHSESMISQDLGRTMVMGIGPPIVTRKPGRPDLQSIFQDHNPSIRIMLLEEHL